MSSIRLNITLPGEIGRRVKKLDNASAFLARAAKKEFDRQDREALARTLAEGYAYTAKEERELNEEYDTASGDGL